MAQQSGSQLNLSCGWTPSPAYARAAAPSDPGWARPRGMGMPADHYVRMHDRKPQPDHVSYADVLRRQRLV